MGRSLELGRRALYSGLLVIALCLVAESSATAAAKDLDAALATQVDAILAANTTNQQKDAALATLAERNPDSAVNIADYAAMKAGADRAPAIGAAIAGRLGSVNRAIEIFRVLATRYPGSAATILAAIRAVVPNAGERMIALLQEIVAAAAGQQQPTQQPGGRPTLGNPGNTGISSTAENPNQRS